MPPLSLNQKLKVGLYSGYGPPENSVYRARLAKGAKQREQLYERLDQRDNLILFPREQVIAEHLCEISKVLSSAQLIEKERLCALVQPVTIAYTKLNVRQWGADYAPFLPVGYGYD